MSENITTFLELLRREGLIVVAILALAYQVYWTTATFADADKLWREELAAYRVQAVEDSQMRLQAGADIAQAMTQMVARLDAIEEATAAIERQLYKETATP
jgi:Tfp pilus assembly protein PilO